MMGNHKKIGQTADLFSKVLKSEILFPRQKENSVFLTLILPVFNCAALIERTLDSIKRQNYFPLEMLVIDASSTDRTLEVINSFGILISRVYTVSHYHIADMINRGITLASGEYISYILPGTVYLACDTLHVFSNQAHIKNFPDLIYCGSLQTRIKKETRIIFLPFNLETLEKGQILATPAACWFRKSLFEHIGKLNQSYRERVDLDFFCRLLQKKPLNISLIDCVFVDVNTGYFSFRTALRSILETFRIILHHFGVKKTLMWFFKLDHLILLRFICDYFKNQFSK